MMGLPPLFVGAVQFSVTWRFPAVAVNVPGDAGAPRGVNEVVTDAPKPAPPRDVTRTV